MPVEKFKKIWPQLPHAGIRSLAVLVAILTTEYGIMFALHWILPPASPLILEAGVDAILLTVVVSPVIWWTVVRPLQQAARLRDHFLNYLFTSIEEERRRIAYELHDGVGQTLTMLVRGLRSPKSDSAADSDSSGQELQALAQRALVDIKQIARQLRPSLLDDLGLAASIERLASELESFSQIQVAVDVQAIAGQRLPDKIETALFRICQEAISNIDRHSHASRASIRVERNAKAVTLQVSDNGRGIQAAESPQHAGSHDHLGLMGMRERASLLGGTFQLGSDEHGTSISVVIPL